jgi:TonB family protein
MVQISIISHHYPVKSVKATNSYIIVKAANPFYTFRILHSADMHPIRTIHFSFPCKEDIDAMDSCDQGKHCKTCDRTIIDFRDKSQEELDELKKSNKHICGIFSEKQVAKGSENYRQLVAKTILAIGLSAFSREVNAQEEIDPFKFPTAIQDTSRKNVVVGVIMDEVPEPEYPGGIKAMRCFFAENLVYPADSVEGKVYVSVIVDTLGRVTNIQIKKPLSPLADAGVVRVAKLMVFKPAILNGKPVNSRISIPCSFSLGKSD